jgi:hypothetical protein
MLEKFRSGDLPGSSGGMKIDDIYDDDNSLPITETDVYFSRDQVMKRTEELLENPWNFTVGVRSNLGRRGDIIRKLSAPQRKESIDDLSDTSELSADELPREVPSDRDDQQTEEGDHIEVVEGLSVDDDRDLNSQQQQQQQQQRQQQQQFDLILHKNVFQLTVSLLKVMNRLKSQKILLIYWKHWKRFVNEINSQQIFAEFKQENELLRATNKLFLSKNEENKSQLEILKIEKLKMEKEFSEKLFQQENLFTSQKKEYEYLKNLYQQLEKCHEKEKEEREEREEKEKRMMAQEMKEFHLQCEMEKNEIILSLEEKNRQQNEELRQSHERRMIEIKSNHEKEKEEVKRELEDWWRNEKETCEKLIVNLKNEEKRISEREWNEKYEEEMKRNDELQVRLEIIHDQHEKRIKEKEKEMKEREEYFSSSLKEHEIEKQNILKINSCLKMEMSEVKRELLEMSEKYEGSCGNIRELREMLSKITNRCKELEKINRKYLSRSEKNDSERTGTGVTGGGGGTGGGGDKQQIEELLQKVKYWEKVSQNLESQLHELQVEFDNLQNLKLQEEKDLKLTIQIKDHMLDNQNILLENLKEKQKAEEIQYEEFMKSMEQTYQKLQMKFHETEDDLQNEMNEMKIKYKNKIKELEESYEQQIEEYVHEITRLRGLLEDKERSIRYHLNPSPDLTSPPSHHQLITSSLTSLLSSCQLDSN